MSCRNIQVLARPWSVPTMSAKLFVAPRINGLHVWERSFPRWVSRPVLGTSWSSRESPSPEFEFDECTSILETSQNRRWNRLSRFVQRVCGRILLHALHKRRFTDRHNRPHGSGTRQFGPEQRISLWGSKWKRRLRKRFGSWLYHQEDCGHPRPNNSKPLGRQKPATIVTRYVLKRFSYKSYTKDNE